MPTPRKGERRKPFMERCVPEVIAEGKDADQAVAQCTSMFDNRNKKKKTTKEIILEKLDQVLRMVRGEKDEI